jgi:hypothetical protein
VKAALGDNLQRIESCMFRRRRRRPRSWKDPPGEIAKKLVEKLRNELRVL